MTLFPIMLLLFLGLPYGIEGLEIDEELTFRFLRVSSTKRTALLNRGLEDGLAVGDHAKFFLTKGVIARGVVIRATLTRSVWSLYKIVDPNIIVEDEVINLKITAPVKLTHNPSKLSFSDNVPLAQSATLPQRNTERPLLESAVEQLQQQDQWKGQQEEFSGLLGSSYLINIKGFLLGLIQNTELVGHFNVNLFTMATDLGRNDSIASTEISTGYSVGMEKYFPETYDLLRNISLAGTFRTGNQKSTLTSGTQSDSSVLEYGGQVNYHFWGHPLAKNRPIGYVGAEMGGGRVTDALTETSWGEDADIVGGTSFFSFYTGMKYLTSNGWRGRIIVGYYQRNEDYFFEEGSDLPDFKKSVGGPSVQLGLSIGW